MTNYNDIISYIEKRNNQLRNPEEAIIPEKCTAFGNTNRDGSINCVVSYYATSKSLRNEAARKTAKKHINYKEIDFDNIPTDGFYISGYSGESSNSLSKTYVTIHDPRGWDISVTLPEVMDLIQSTGYINQKFAKPIIYVWLDGALALVGVNEQEYAELKQVREGYGAVPRKAWVTGQMYMTKKGPAWYFGKFTPFTYKKTRDVTKTQTELNQYVDMYEFVKGETVDLVYFVKNNFLSHVGKKDKLKMLQPPGMPCLTPEQVTAYRKRYINLYYMPAVDDMEELPVPEDIQSIDIVPFQDENNSADRFYSVSKNKDIILDINSRSQNNVECHRHFYLDNGHIYHLDYWNSMINWCPKDFILKEKLPDYQHVDNAAYLLAVDKTGNSFIFNHIQSGYITKELNQLLSTFQ